MKWFQICLLLSLMTSASARSFMEADSATETDMSDMMAVLLTGAHPDAVSLTESVRDQHGKDSHSRNQAALQSMFNALPKNDKGNLGVTAARYALHRLFEHRHRWFVRGLHPSMSSKATTKSHSIGQALETLGQLDSKGMSLPALAALAGTLEQLIQKELAAHLKDFFKSQGILDEGDGVTTYPKNFEVSGSKLAEVVESYMVVYISGASWAKTSKEEVQQDDDFMATETKDWTETKEWVKSTFMDVVKTEGGCADELKSCTFYFEDAARVVQAVVEKYGFFNDRACHQVKGKLLDMQEVGTGRVALADFYKAGQSTAWEFNEKRDYLRSLGALDESSKDDPKVLVPNYVSSWVNCLNPSKFYSVCCRNECEDYMQVVEKRVDGAMGDPSQILTLVQTHSVFTEDAPTSFTALRRRLFSIADKNDGKVPIHGRLFAQWMHHAFPATCPYPHEAGTTNPQTPDEWMAENGHTEIKASEGEMEAVVSKAKNRGFGNWEAKDKEAKDKETTSQEKMSEAAEFASELPWSDVEELLVVRPAAQKSQSVGKSMMDRFIVLIECLMVAALVGTAVWMAREHTGARKAYSKGHYA